MSHSHPQPIYLCNYKVSDYLVDSIHLEFQLDEESTLVKARSVFKANPLASGSNDLVLHGENLELTSITLNEKPLLVNHYALSESTLTVFNVPSQFTLEVHTRFSPRRNDALSGLYVSNSIFCTQCEAEGFRRITYFLDRPDVLARYTTTIIANKHQYPILLSNGNRVASGEGLDETHWVTWEDPFPKPSYLFALVAGDLDSVSDFFITRSGRRVELFVYVEKGYRDQCDHAMKALKKAMRWDEEAFGREYDLDIYMIVAINDFNMGAMENKGLNIFNTQYILASPDKATDSDFIQVESVIAHEYCHNWSGNRVTCRDWFQLSLKEGLTIYRDQRFTEATMSKTVARIHSVRDLRQVQFSEDAGPLAHPVRPESYIEINNFYTATVYNKGAEIIRMLHTLLGETTFRNALDLYFETYDGKAATIDDFVEIMESVSGMDLTQFRWWYTQAGTPVLSVTDQYDEKTSRYTLTIEQSCPPTPHTGKKQPFHIPIKIGLLNPSGHEMMSDLLELKDSRQSFHFEQIHTKPIPSLLRDFSAPVKLQYTYTDDELLFLMKHDTNWFNRWEASQQYGVRAILNQIHPDDSDKKSMAVSSDFLNTFAFLINDLRHDLLFLTEILTLPSEKYLYEHMTVIDVNGIHRVREFFQETIGNALSSPLSGAYQSLIQKTKDQFSLDAMGQRSFKNLCLAYLLKSDGGFQKLALQQFETALTENMTDAFSALSVLKDIDCTERELAFAKFFDHFKMFPLIVDKWFALQACSVLPDTVSRVKTLCQHPAFDIKNPNKVYALIGSFCQRNTVQFHAADGAGYAFLVDRVLEIDAFNPQVAAHIVKPLTNWRRYDTVRQEKMRDCLQQILNTKPLSKNVYEIVSKSL